MKISIITVLNTINYGSVLQTLATQKLFEDLGFEVEFIDYWRSDQQLKNLIKFEVNKKSNTFVQRIKKPLKCLLDIISVCKGHRIFRMFVKKNIHLSKNKYTSNYELKINLPDADIYCTGSDQMWNSSWNQGIEKSFFLDFVPENKKRIAFSTSIGKTELSESESNAVVPLLRKYDFITLREQSAVELLSKFDISSSLVLDPTLMYDRFFWKQFMPKRKVQKPYLLVNKLHFEHDNVDFNKAVKEFAIKMNLEVVRIAYTYSDLNDGKKIYIPGIFEFLSLIYYADFIVTDSFHTTAFSINFNKQFAVFYPEKFSTRLDNILEIVNLKSRRYIDGNDIKNFLKIIEYSSVNYKLETARNEAANKYNTLLKNF